MQPGYFLPQHSVRYGDEVICFSLRHQPLRNTTRVAIHVEPNGNVVVDAPVDAPLHSVLAAVKKRSRWIL